MANTVYHPSDSRGIADHGWLQSRHTFSFANYYDPNRVHFGALRVLNDDIVAPGMGFGAHPHDNMEIISIPLEGELEHKDSLGTTAVIRKGDIQVMSAGRGVTHSEYNKSKEKPVSFLQIWIFPDKKNVEPRYDQVTLNDEDRKNKFQQVVSPDPNDEGVWINQQAWFHMGIFDRGITVEYSLKRNRNGVYVFILKGAATVLGQKLRERDGFGIWDVDRFDVRADAGDTHLLLMEVPMGL